MISRSSWRQRQRHRLQIQEVAEEHRDVIAPPRVHGLAAAAQLRLVDDVVVDERRGVDELDHRRVEHRALAGVAGHARRHQQHRRPNPLAAAVLDVVADRGNERDLRLHVPGELAFDLAKVFANRLEHLRESGGRMVSARWDSSLSDQTISRAECQRAARR